MGINITWDNPQQTVILVQYQRPWDWSQFSAALGELKNLLDSVHHTVDIIFDIRDAGFPPQGAVQRFKQASELNHPNGGLLIYVAPNLLAQFVKSIVRIIEAAFGRFEADFLFVSTPEQARDMIAQRRGTQPKAG